MNISRYPIQRSVIFLTLTLLGACFLQGQSGVIVIPTTYRLYLDNPAIVGLDGNHHLMLGAGKDYLGIRQSPTTSFLAGSTPNASGRLGFGGMLFHDRAGLLRQTQASVFAAVHSDPENTSTISLGASAQFQFSRIAMPNVPDIIPADGLSDVGINLGLAVNYRLRFGPDCRNSFNLMGYLPQLPRTLTFVNEQNQELTVLNRIPARLQANARFETDGNLVVTPALMVQSWPGGDSLQGEGASIVDVSVGFGSIYGFEARIGLTTGAANSAHLGVSIPLGISDWKGHIWSQPFGPLGASALAALEFEQQAVERDIDCTAKTPGGNDSPVPPTPPTPEDPGPEPEHPETKPRLYYNDANLLNERLRSQELDLAFDADVTTSSIYNQVRPAFELKDDDDFLLNPFEDEYYLEDFPLDQLAEEIQHLDDVARENGEYIKEIQFFGVSSKPVEAASEVRFPGGEPMSITYQDNQDITRNDEIVPGDVLTHGEVSYLKLNAIRAYFQDRTSLPTSIDMRVIHLEQSPGTLDVSRVLRIVVFIQKGD